MMTKLRLIFTLGFLKEAISSLIPTILAYLQFYEEKFSNSSIILAIITFLVLFIIMLFLKIREYRKSVAKALAYGYYQNFVQKIYSLIESKGKNKIEFIFENTTEKFRPKDIIIKINLVKSYVLFQKKSREIKEKYQIAYINSDAYNHPFFVYAKIKGDKIIIEDIPRTLFALKFYVDPNLDSIQKISKETINYFSSFNKEFKKLWSKIDQNNSKFVLKTTANRVDGSARN